MPLFQFNFFSTSTPKAVKMPLYPCHSERPEKPKDPREERVLLCKRSGVTHHVARKREDHVERWAARNFSASSQEPQEFDALNDRRSDQSCFNNKRAQILTISMIHFPVPMFLIDNVISLLSAMQ